MSNREFAATVAAFQRACAAVKIPATARQASKWRRGKGLAWKSVLAAGVLMLLVWPAWAETHRIELKDADVENTTVDKKLHPDPGTTGDTHWDLEFDQNGGSVVTEHAYVHDKYPVNGVQYYRAIFNVETNETTIGKQFCIEYIGCAFATGDYIGGCNRATPLPATGYVIWTVPATGNSFATSFTTTPGTIDTITHGDGSAGLCTFDPSGDCAHAKVVYRLRINNNLVACTNPSTNKLRIQWMETITP